MILPDSERLDTLVALALAFSGSDEHERVFDPLSALDPADTLRVELRRKWCMALSDKERFMWLARVLGRARSGRRFTRLDEQMHPSHIVEALNEEPRRIREIVLRHLPRSLSDDANTIFDYENIGPAHYENRSSPSPEIMDVIRCVFLSRFICRDELINPTAVDRLTGAELARLMRLAGARELALACRGIPQSGIVASLVRRFPNGEGGSIAHLMVLLPVLDPCRAHFAEQLVCESFKTGVEPGEILNRIGCRLLLVAISEQEDAQRVRYIAQKLPVEAAEILRDEAAIIGDRNDPEIARMIADEIETLARSLHCPTRERGNKGRCR